MKIPEQATCVFKGKIFDTYQWEQTMFDGSTETFEMLKRATAIEIIPVKDNKIFYADQEQPSKGRFFSLFGGRVEDGENWLSAAKRELREEAGMESDDWELLTVFEPYTKIDWEIPLYVARNAHFIGAQNLDAGEKITVKECLFEELPDILTDKKFRGNEFAFNFLKMKFLEPAKFEEFKKKLGLN